jgi:2,4-diaminopentanoate dehydrogenase
VPIRGTRHQCRDDLDIPVGEPEDLFARVPRAHPSRVPEGWQHGLFHRLAIAALACADKVDCVRVLELGWWGDYSAEFVSREYFGFGKEPGFQPLLITTGWLSTAWQPTLHEIADALGVAIDDYCVVYETDSLDYDIETGFGTVRAGTASAVHFELQGLVDGQPVVVVEHNDLVGRDAGKKWKLPYGPSEMAYRIEIEGDPAYSVELNMGPEPGAKMTAMPVVNSIPAVCQASPGLKSPLEIPRYWSRNVSARKAAAHD